MAATPTATLIDVIVLVFARSELKTLVGTDALRTVLAGSQRELFPEPGTMSLQPVWELIESQPGFDADKAIPPMCRIKTWEGHLKVKVAMPVALDHLDLETRDKKAMECNVGDDDLLKIIKPAAAAAPKKATTRAIESTSVSGKQSKRSIGPKIAAIAAVLGVAAAGVSIYLTFGRDDNPTVKLAPSDLSAELPMTNLKRNGKLMVATLSDDSWLAKPEDVRRKQLEAMAPKMRAQQANALTLLDKRGNIVATLRLDSKTPIAFPPKK
jgi:hypothetical protein